MQKVAKFYDLDRQYAKCRAASAEERQERVSRMAKLVSEAMRAVMIPTPLTRFHQRIDIVTHKLEIREAFEGYQYGACMPGGTENITRLARVCWDHGIPFVQSDVPNGFPGANLKQVYDAVSAIIPGMLPSFLRWKKQKHY